MRPRVSMLCLVALTWSVAPSGFADPGASGHSTGVTVTSAEGLITNAANPFDLAGRTLRFRAHPAGGYDVSADPVEPFVDVGVRLAPASATNVAFASSWIVPLPFAFPFGGAHWQEVSVNLNGNLSFGRSEVEVWPERDIWSDGTMRSVAAALDARSAVGGERVIAALWAIYSTQAIVSADLHGDRAVFTWRATRRTGPNSFYEPLGNNLFRATLFPSGDVALSFWEVAEIDGIVGLFTNAPASLAQLDDVSEPGDAPHQSVDIERVELRDHGTTIRAVVTMGAEVPERLATGQLLGYRLFFNIRGRECSLGVFVDTTRRYSSNACNPAPRVLGWQVAGRTVEITISKSIFDGASVVTWAMDSVWWGVPGRFDQVNSARWREVNLAPGKGEHDLSSPRIANGGSVFEIFHYPVVPKQIDFALKTLYRRYPADDEIAVVMTDFRVDDLANGGPGTGAVNFPVSGIGSQFATPRSGAAFGSSRLQVSMSPLYVGGPRSSRTIASVPGMHPFIVNWIAHEAGHRWLAHLRWRNPATGAVQSLAIPDGCQCHWSEWLHTASFATVGPEYAGTAYVEHSPMGGSSWEDHGDGTFTRRVRLNNAVPSGFSALDLYAMGLFAPEEVPDTFYLMDPQPISGQRYRATKVPVRIEDIISVEGPRIPSSREAQRNFRFGMYLLHEPGRVVRDDMLERVLGIADAFERYMHLATARRMGMMRAGGTVMRAAPPVGLFVSGMHGNLVTLRWTIPHGEPTPTSFLLEGGVGPGQVLASLPTGSAAPTFTFAAPSGSYYVRMHALNGTLRSPASNEIQLHVNVPVVPSAPANVLGLVNGTTVALAWTNTFAGGAPISLVLDVTGSIVASLPLDLGDQVSFAGVPTGTYTLALRAQNAGGRSPPSHTVTLVVPGPCSGPPSMPTDVAASRAGRTVSITWSPGPSGPAPSSFVVHVTGAFAGSFSTSTRTLSGVVGPGFYTLSVVAVNACGVSAATPPHTVTVA